MANSEHLSILDRGPRFWNEWKGQHPAEVIDLKEIDLFNPKDEHIDLSGINLRGADLRKAKFVRYDFTNLPGKSESTKELEWLQTSHFQNEVIITIDSNRTAFVFFDIFAQKRMIVPFDTNWAVQDFVILDSYQKELFDKIEDSFR